MISTKISFQDEFDTHSFHKLQKQMNRIINYPGEIPQWISINNLEAQINLSNPILSPPRHIHELFKPRATERKLICTIRKSAGHSSQIYDEKNASNMQSFVKSMKNLCTHKRVVLQLKPASDLHSGRPL